MGTKYSNTVISGYNPGSPADDGSAVEANRVTWAKHKTKLADPILTLSKAINTALLAHVDESVADKAVNYTTVAADHKRTLNVTAAATVSLGDAGTLGAGYIVTVKNSNVAAITINLATGTDTLDGTAAGSLVVQPKNSAAFITNVAANGFYQQSLSGGLGDGGLGGFASGTLLTFPQANAPTGWTKQVVHNDKALRVVSGAGGGSAGATAFTTVFGAGKTAGVHTLTAAEVPAHDHGAGGAHTHTVPQGSGSGAGTRLLEGVGGAATVATTSDGAHTHTSFGGGGTHDHTLSLDLQYVDILICAKD